MTLHQHTVYGKNVADQKPLGKKRLTQMIVVVEGISAAGWLIGFQRQECICIAKKRPLCSVFVL
jgi:hypothetical protein